MALVSAAEYAASEGAKKAYADAMDYQARNPSTSSYLGQANDPGSAAYRGGSNPDAKLPTPNNNSSEPYGKAAMSDLASTPQGEGSTPMFRNGQFLGYSKGTGAANTVQAPPTAVSAATMPNQGLQQGNTMGIGALESSQFNNPASPATGATNAQSLIDQAIAAQKSAAIAALGKSRDNALSNLSAEKTGIQPKYQDAKNQMSAGAQQQARNFAEFMANRGGASSGAAAQAQLMQDQTTQGGMSDLARQEMQAYTDIARRQSDVGNAYESDVASSSAGAEADKMKLLLQDFYTAQQRGDAQKQQDIQNKIAEANLQLQQAQLRSGQANADRTFNYQSGQDTINNNRNAANDAASYLGNYTDPQTAAIKQKISANSAAWFNASPTERTRLAAENQSLGASIGAKQDEAGNWIMPQPQRTVEGQKMDFGQNLAISELKFKVDSYKQKFDEDVRQFDVKTALDEAYRAGQLTVQQYQAATQRMQANTSATSAANAARNSANSQGLANQKYNDEKNAKELEGEVYGHSQEFNNAKDVEEYFKVNGSYIASKLGATDVAKLKSTFLAPFASTDKLGMSAEDKAISLASQDPSWKYSTLDERKALVEQYKQLR